MKRFLIFFIPFLFAVLALAVVAPTFIDWNQYRDQIRAGVREASGYDITINEGISLAILPVPYLSLRDVTIENPDAGQQSALASVKKLHLSLELFPLLEGRINVSSLDLVDPVVSLYVDANGDPNWLTQKLSPEQNGQEGAQENENQTSSSYTPDVAINTISISGGSLTYIDAAAGTSHEITNMDLELAAQSFSGPFEISGAFAYAGIPLEIEAATSALNNGQPSEVEATLTLANNSFRYIGGISFLEENISAQGKFSAEISTPASLLEQLGATEVQLYGINRISADSILSFKGETVSLSDLSLTLNEALASGRLEYHLTRQSLTGNVEFQEPLSLTGVMPGKGNNAVFSGKPVQSPDTQASMEKGLFLPKSHSMALPGPLDLKISLPGLRLDGKDLGSTSLALKADNQKASGNADIKGLPGQGNFSGSFDFLYGQKTQGGATNTFVNPQLKALIKANTNDVKAMAAFLDLDQQSLPQAIKTAALDANLTITPDSLKLEQTTVKLDEKSYSGSGSLDSSKLLVNMDLNGGTLIAEQPMEGVIAFDKIPDNMVLQVKHQNTGAKLQGFTGQPYESLNGKALDFYGIVSQTGDILTISEIKAVLAGVQGQGSLTLNTASEIPDISANLVFGDLDLNNFTNARTSGPSSANATSASTQQGSMWSAEPMDFSWMEAANIKADIQARSLTTGTWTFSTPKIALNLQNGTLDLTNLDAGLYGGRATLAGRAIKNGNSIRTQLDAKASDINLEPLVKSFAGASILTGSGIINLESSFETAGSSQKELIGALSGKGTLSGENLLLEGFDVHRFARALSQETKPGDTAQGILNAFKGGQTAYETMEGSYAINNGIAEIEELTLIGETSEIATTGRVDLPRWRLDTAHEFTVKGQGDIPSFTVRLQGPLDNPAQTFGEGLVKDYLNRKLQRKAQDLIQDKLGDKPIGKVLQGILGGGQQPQPQPQPQPQQQQEQSVQQPANDNEIQPGQDNSVQPQETQTEANPPITPDKAIEGVLKNLLSNN